MTQKCTPFFLPTGCYILDGNADLGGKYTDIYIFFYPTLPSRLT